MTLICPFCKKLVVLIFFKKTRFEIFLIFKVEDRIKLLANIEMDEDLIRLREKQIKEQQKQVLPKPNIDNNNAVKQGNLFQGIVNKTIKRYLNTAPLGSPFGYG